MIAFACGNGGDSQDMPPSNTDTIVETPSTEAPITVSDAPVETVEPSAPEKSTKDYQELYEDGSLKIEGDFDADGQRQGIWVSYYESGIKWSESHYSHGAREGHSITFYPNGKVRYVGEYKDDQKIGKWTFYTEAGDLDQEIEY